MNPKQFYNFVNIKRKYSVIRSKLFFENLQADTDQAMAGMFAKILHTTFYTKYSFYPYNILCSNGILTHLLNERSLVKTHHSVKQFFLPGLDGVPACVLRFCTNSISKPLLKLFAQSLNTSLFPSILKELFITLLLKSGSK